MAHSLPSDDRSITISACLIVRDEASTLPQCLGSIWPVVDEVIVHDTGSLDSTVAVAENSGATVILGRWHDNFSVARNIATAAASSDWILSVDADEIVVADVAALRQTLEAAGDDVDAFSVAISNSSGPDSRGLDGHSEVKLFRRDRSIYVGRVHEHVERVDDQQLGVVELSPEVLRYVHSGYSAADLATAKARRNARLCQMELDALNSQGVAESASVARAALDLGRSLMGAGERRAAVDALELVRALPERGAEWAWATDLLARIWLAAEKPYDVLELSNELAASGRAPAYCAWLRAQALGLLGEAEECYQLLRSIASVQDLAGRELNFGQVLELTALAAAHSGRIEEAFDIAAEATMRYRRKFTLPASV